ncbi:hypothetical protein [Sediminitomix flava]|uniref:Fucose-specific lectin n=1 Tax=Sediminitomix flava TaxID=379075 RepID=A0A315YY24_SEDFL|nr:hypothetical protein [Sediminitomix flava]PWJ34963.1 hypothetical protein BC781_1104 [Sediminitomix flava]
MSTSNSRPNQPATISANAQLMQNYAIPSAPLGAWSMFAVGHEVGEQGKSQIHLYGVSDGNSNKVYHVFKNIKSDTGWSKEQLSFDNSNLDVQQIVCGIDPEDGKSVVFVQAKDTSSNEYQVYFQKNGTSSWYQVGKFPSGADHQYLSCGAMNNKLVLMASYNSTNKSKVKQIDWKNKSSDWSDISNDVCKIYCINVGAGVDKDGNPKDGVWASVKDSSGEHKLTFFDGKSKDGVTLGYKQKDSYYNKVQAPPTSSKNYSETFGMTEKGGLYDVIGSKKYTIFSHQSEITDFSIVQPNLEVNVKGETYKDDKWHAFGVNDQNQLLHSYTTPSSSNNWKDAIPFMDSISKVQSIVTKDFVSVFVMNTNGYITELQREAITSEWRKVPIYIPKEFPSKAIDDIDYLTVGNSQANEDGTPDFHVGSIKSSNGCVHRYSESEATPDDVYLPEIWDLRDDNNNIIKVDQITSASDVNGQTVFFIMDHNRRIYYRRMENLEWTYVYQLASDTDYRKIVAGIISYEGEEKLRLLASYTLSSDRKSQVISIDWEGDHSSKELTNHYDKIFDVSIGKTSLGDGFFASIQDETKDEHYSVRFYLYGNKNPQKYYRKNNDHHYKSVYGVNVPKRFEDEVFVRDYYGNLSYTQIVSGKSKTTQIASNISDAQVALSKKKDTSYVLSLFVTDNDHKAYQYNLKTDSKWSHEQVAKNIQYLSLGCNPWTGRWVQCFGATQDAHLVVLASDKWSKDYKGETINKVTDADLDTPEEFESYTSEVTIGDLNGIGVAGQKVHFLPLDDATRVDVNGIVYYLSPNDKPLSMITNGNGRATFTVIATNLHTSQMKVWADFMENDDVLVVQPNGEIQDYLKYINTDELKHAQKQNEDGSTSNLFKDKSVVDDEFTDAVNNVMEMSMPSEEASRRVDLSPQISPRCNRKQVHYTTHEHAQELRYLNPQGKDYNFQIEFVKGAGVKFHQLDAETVKIASANAKKGIYGHPDNPTIPLNYSVESDSPEPIESKFGDVFASINNNLSTDNCESITIETVEEAREHQRGLFKRIKATVTFVKEKVTYVWEGFINLVEDAFDVLQSVFAHVQVFFRDLFEWLGSFFCWQDILNTQTAAIEMFNTTLEGLPDVIRKSKFAFDSLNESVLNEDPAVPEGDVFQSTHNDGVNDGNQANAKYGNPGMEGEDQNAPQNDEDKQYYGDTPQGNWFMSQITNAMSRVDAGIQISKELEDVVQEFINEIEGIVKPDEVTDALMPIYDLFQSKEGNGGIIETMQVTMEAVSSSLKSMLLKSLNAGIELFVTMVEKISDIMNSRINLPLITPLYEKVINTGSTLTYLNLVSLMGAVPSTLGYKFFTLIKTGTALSPFVSTENDIQNEDYQVSLEAYSNYLSIPDMRLSQVMMSAMMGEEVEVSSPSKSAQKASYVISHVFGFFYSYAYMNIGAADFMANRCLLPYDVVSRNYREEVDKFFGKKDIPFDEVQRFFSGTIISSSIFAQSISSPWYVGLDSFPKKGSSAYIEFIIWCCQWTLNILDIAGFVCTYNKYEKGQKAVTALTSIAGLAHLASFIYLAVEGDKELKKSTHKNYDRAELGLKTSQNVLTSLGESLAFTSLMSNNPFNGNSNPKILMSALYDGLCFEAVGIINLARTITSLSCTDIHERHVDV